MVKKNYYPKTTESTLQIACAAWLKRNGILGFHVPNGGLRNIKVAMKLKQEGVMAGVSDLIIVLRGRIIFVELKATGNTLTEYQKTFRNAVTKLGYEYHLITSSNGQDAANQLALIVRGSHDASQS